MRTDPERVSLDLIARKLAECSDEELAALVGAERLLRLKAPGEDATCECNVCGRLGPTWACKHGGYACNCCPEHRCGA